MAMVDLEDDKGIERAKGKERVNKAHTWCPKCGRPRRCNNPECTHITHCSCGQL
jgi:hypothetical protein